MEWYKIIKEIGDGTFGSVSRAIHKQTGEVVAIKRMKKKYYSWEECLNLREVRSLRRMNHPNIVKLKEVIRANNNLFFVFEHMDCNLYQLMKDRRKEFSESEVRNWCFQVFQALAYMHQRGFFHRDLKPENLLVSKLVIKIADFGLAREICSKPPYTEYVSTRWYRAPEILLQSPVYGPAVDMWAMGAIMAELFTLRPLFPGASEADEIYRICNVLGTPNMDSWADGLRLAATMNYQFPQCASVHLSELIPSCSEDAISLIRSLCSWDPCKRPTAFEVLQHPFFQPCFYVPPSLRMRMSTTKTPPSAGIKGVLDQKTARKYSVASPISKSLNFNDVVSATMSTGVQRKLDLYNLVDTDDKSEKPVKNFSKEPRYQVPAKKNLAAGRTMNGILLDATTGKLEQMTINSVKQQQPVMRSGGWHNPPGLLRSHQSPATRNYPRKLAS